MPKKDKPSPKKRKRGLREESQRGDHRADQAWHGALAETLEAGGGSTPGEFCNREAVRGEGTACI